MAMMAQAQLLMKDREEQGAYRAPRVSMSMADFEIISRLGDGSFSTVILVKHKVSGKHYAMKMVNKHLVMRNKMVDYIINERNILDQLDYDGICKLHFTFQDAESLYMGMEQCPGGELYEQLQKRGTFSVEDTKFYAAEIVLILEYLRKKDVVHRDLKPENLLLSAEGHLKLIDFGSAKAFFLEQAQGPRKSMAKNRATSFVGTAEYVSPEVLNNTGVSFSADLWALGCILYQMLVGRPPFKGASEYLTFQNITARELSFPADLDPTARDLIDKLLDLEPRARIGSRSMADLKEHGFFAGVDWLKLRNGPAPVFEPPKPVSSEEEALDWELTSLTRDHMGPVHYSYD